MKKYIIAVALLFALPALVLAYFTPATLTDGVHRVAVYSQTAAQKYFGLGYILEDNNQGDLEDLEALGGTSGTIHTQPERFLAGFSGGVLATSTSGSATYLKEKELNLYTVIEMMLNVTNFTYTLPATSTLTSLLKNAGDTRSWIFQNATSSTMTLTVVKGTGWDLVAYANDDDVLTGNTDIYMKLDCYRKANTDIACLIGEYINAD